MRNDLLIFGDCRERDGSGVLVGGGRSGCGRIARVGRIGDAEEKGASTIAIVGGGVADWAGGDFSGEVSFFGGGAGECSVRRRGYFGAESCELSGCGVVAVGVSAPGADSLVGGLRTVVGNAAGDAGFSDHSGVGDTCQGGGASGGGAVARRRVFVYLAGRADFAHRADGGVSGWMRVDGAKGRGASGAGVFGRIVGLVI